MRNLPRFRSRLMLVLLAACTGPLGTARVLASEPPVDDPAWLEWVAPLMVAEERQTYETLRHRYERAEFVERFWQSRDPDPSTPRNELRRDWADRLATAEREFGGTTTDRGTAFLLNGAPDFILSEICPQSLKPLEIWLYGEPDEIEGANASKTLVFATIGDEQPVLVDGGSLSAESLLLKEPPPRVPAARFFDRQCRRSSEVRAALQRASERSAALRPPSVGEWLERFQLEIAGSSDNPLASELSLEFPASIRGQTAVDIFLAMFPESPTSARSVSIEGDIFRDDHRADHFRYRFEVPPTSPTEGFVLSFRRHLSPGAYRMALAARDLTFRRSAHFDQDLRVPTPEVPDPTVVGGAPASDPGSPFKITPLSLGLLTGRQRIEVVAASERISSVSFLLDGREVMTKRRAPFSVEIDLGSRPRTHTLEAVARDEDGAEIARDSVPINAGPHRFSVRILEPHRGSRSSHSVRIHARVDVPPDETLDRVEVFLNESRVATMYQPPFTLPQVGFSLQSDAGYVRALAILDDGNSAEDLVVVNASGDVDRLQVDFVEIYAGVVDRKGAPVTGLGRNDFTVLEDGIEQAIRRFETVHDLPINAAVVLDTSESMYDEIDEAKGGAARFFENVLRPMDRAAVVVFSDKPELKVPLTNDPRRLEAGLDDISADGETTLYDSVVFGLYYLLGLRGKRALVLLTDGADSQSRYGFEDMVDFARSSGVAIYPIGIGLTSRDIEAQRVLRTLALETGGEYFAIASARELERIYSKIEDELRSQYLIGYQSSQTDTKEFRELKILVAGKGLEVKTIPGYHP